MIIRGGHNIDANLIEEVLIRHPGVQLAAAIGRPDPAKGELPVAFVQLKAGATTTVEELLDLCRKEVQERAAVPVSISIVEQMPMTAVGKISKPVLRRAITCEIASAVAKEVLRDERSFEIIMDDSGARPLVSLTVAGGPDPRFEKELEEAFKTYEFTTRIEFAGRS